MGQHWDYCPNQSKFTCLMEMTVSANSGCPTVAAIHRVNVIIQKKSIDVDQCNYRHFVKNLYHEKRAFG